MKAKEILVLSIVVSIISGALAAFVVTEIQSSNQLKEFYSLETDVHVSPHGLRKHMDKGDDTFILVDVRSQEEYEREHIIGAINIPAYKDPDTSAYGDVERIVSEFSKLPKGKDIIVYCYSIPCMTGRKVGNMLAKEGIYVQQLGIGWNEWRYYWNMWNHEHEWNQTNVEDYIYSGSEPGVPEVKVNSTVCKIEGELGC